MKVKIPIQLNKRQRFVAAVFILSLALFISEFFFGTRVIIAGFILAILTDVMLYLILKEDVKGTFFYPILILPFLYTLSFALFYPLLPARLLSKILITGVYAFGLYSLLLTQNIFAVSSIRTINLLRSARIVSFVISIFTLFFLIHIIFSLHFPVFVTPFPIFLIMFLMNYQSLWVYTLDQSRIREVFFYAVLVSFALAELSVGLSVWPVNASLYAIFLTSIFYSYSGLAHAWVERRLFKGVLWEFAWVGALSILILVIFSDWGF